MSAFFDIAITTEKLPVFHRRMNLPWEKQDHQGFTYWTSLPVKQRASFLKQFQTAEYQIILIGMLYEKLTDGDILKRCTQYINSRESFDDPAGHYILFVLEKKDNSYHVFTNRFGTYHAYWHDGNMISTYFFGMAKQSEKKELDWKAIAGFMGMGFFPNDATYLTDIKIFEPASYYKFDSNLNLQVKKRYWNWVYRESSYDFTTAANSLYDTLSTSINNAIGDCSAALPISGGLDSRLLAGVISRNDNKRIQAFSYGFAKSSIEIKIAVKVAHACNIPFSKYVVPPYLFDKMDTIVDSVEAFQYVDGTRQACITDFLENNCDVVVGGHWGDVWMDSMQIKNGSIDSLETVFKNKIFKKGSGLLFQKLTDHYVGNSGTLLNEYFQQSISKTENIPDPNFRMKIFKTDQWSFRWTLASIRMYEAGAMPVLPFYDKNVAEILMSIPDEYLAGRRFQVEFIKKYFPQLASIKWQEYNSNLYNYKWLNNRNLLYRAGKKAQRVIAKKKIIIRNADLFYLNESGRACLYEALTESKLSNYMPRECIDKLVNLYYKDPSASHTYAISMLHTFAQFLKKIGE